MMRTISSLQAQRHWQIAAIAVALAACSNQDAPVNVDDVVDEPAETADADAGLDARVRPLDAAISKPVTSDGGAPASDAASSTADASARDASTSTSDASTPVLDASSQARPPASSLSFPTVVEPHLRDQPIFNVTRPSDLALPGGALPVVVWANGGCLRSDFTWSPLFKRWAEAGFVVLSLAAASDDLFAMLGTTGKAEHAKLIDWVVAQNESGPYAGKLDLERIVVAGNSCGGVTALQVAATDERPAAVFVLSGSSALGSVDTNIMKAITVPVGYVVGGPEDIAGANATGDYEAMNDGVPGMIVSRREGDHQTVSTDAKILPEDAEIALNWMDLALYGTKLAYEALSAPNVCGKCTPGDWTLKSKHLETLVK